MPPFGVRMPVPLSFKLPLTAKSVTLFLFFDFRPSHAMAIVWAAGSESRIKIRVQRYGRREAAFEKPLGTANRPPVVKQGDTCPNAARVPLLIELIFCLGSIWAKLDLAFLASVICDSMISMRSLLIVRAYPRRLFPSRTNQMNLTCPYNLSSCYRPIPTR